MSIMRTPPDGAAGHPLSTVITDQSAQASTLFIHGGGDTWYQPLAVYPSRWFLRAGVSPELALRLPAAVAGMLTMVFGYMLVARLTGDAVMGALVVLFLIAMPGFRLASHTPGAGLFMVAFVLAWFVAVLQYVGRPRLWLAFAGGAVLGLSIYTQPAGVLSVPVFLALGAIVLGRAERGSAAVWSSVIGVAVVSLPAVMWIIVHRDAYPDTFGRWAIHAAHVRSPWQGIVAFTHWPVMARRVEEYWHYVNPTFLFSRAMWGLPLVALVPYGCWVIGDRGPSIDRVIVLGGLVAAPAAAALLDMPREPSLVWMALPFAAVLAAQAARTILSLTGVAK